MPTTPDHRISIAPMLDWTDRHYRYFMRLISQRCQLYTEMITTGAILNGDRDYHLGFDQSEHPLVVQLGGSHPQHLAECSRIVEQYGYDEINLNIGCPSDRVQEGRFGACLMAEPSLVAECFDAMSSVVKIPVTIKCRLGIDDQDSYRFLTIFIDEIAKAGCQHFIIHARKAWLNGLSPKENREIPPLNYERVYQLKQDHPSLQISINGGITTLEACHQHLQAVDGVMIGREAYHNPYLFAEVDQQFYGENSKILSRMEILEQLYPYIESELRKGARLNYITRHILGLFQGVPGARAWRRHLSENAHRTGAGLDIVKEAAKLISH